LEPDPTCSSLDWSFLGVAPSHSQFAGVLGGFIFVAIFTFVSTWRGNTHKLPNLSLLLTAFFVLALDSMLFGIISGERVCIRAYTEGVVASGLLAIGAGSVFAGIAHVLDLHEVDRDLARLSRLLVYTSQAIAIAFMSVTVFGFLDYLPGTPSWSYGHPPQWWQLAYIVVLFALLTAAIYFRPTSADGARRALRLASYATTLYGLVGAAIFGAAASIPGTTWRTSTPAVLPLAITAATIFPPIALLTLARTLPQFEPVKDDTHRPSLKLRPTARQSTNLPRPRPRRRRVTPQRR
jgi:hypothetical protein